MKYRKTRPGPATKTITPWKKYCDYLWMRIIKLRAGCICEICGEVHRADGGIRQLHAHHLIDREVLVYRYHLMNGICLCSQCHEIDKHGAAHRNPRVFWERWLIKCDMSMDEQWDWFGANLYTGPAQDKLKPKLKDYPGIADTLETELARLS